METYLKATSFFIINAVRTSVYKAWCLWVCLRLGSHKYTQTYIHTRNFSVPKKQCGSYKFLYPVTFPWPSDYFLQSGAQASKLPTLPLIQLCFWQSSFTEKIILYIRCFLWPVPRSLYLITYIYIYLQG